MKTFEPSDVSQKGLFITAAALVVVVALTFLGMKWWLHAKEQPHPSPVSRTAPLEVPAPRLQPNPTADLVKLRAAEQRALSEYGWVDRNAGIVRIPIDRAIDLTLERGLPTRPAAQE